MRYQISKEDAQDVHPLFFVKERAATLQGNLE